MVHFYLHGFSQLNDPCFLKESNWLVYRIDWTFGIILYLWNNTNRLIVRIHTNKSPSFSHWQPAPHWGIFITRPTGGGGGYFEPPPLISETTGPILKIQAAFESPGKTVEGKQILLTSGSRVTSQVRSKSKCLTIRAWWHRRAKLRC